MTEMKIYLSLIKKMADEHSDKIKKNNGKCLKFYDEGYCLGLCHGIVKAAQESPTLSESEKTVIWNAWNEMFLESFLYIG